MSDILEKEPRNALGNLPARDPKETDGARLIDNDEEITADDILIVRRGPGANCSSIGSALDVLFLSAVAAGVLLAGVAAAIGEHARPAQPARRGPNAADKDNASASAADAAADAKERDASPT